uniref:Uncharacterized protein n=1 Tax=Trepomonas sp. PC1 TaxID=1076344 RepID=A0A146KGM8_9EUKA|eukprot:JAP95298.1 Hypothetical protein TPC1_11760 [Trepomonas sp. PC1]
MCYLTNCQKCGKITWTGCGQHLSTIFDEVDKNNVCECGHDSKPLESAKAKQKTNLVDFVLIPSLVGLVLIYRLVKQ